MPDCDATFHRASGSSRTRRTTWARSSAGLYVAAQLAAAAKSRRAKTPVQRINGRQPPYRASSRSSAQHRAVSRRWRADCRLMRRRYSNSSTQSTVSGANAERRVDRGAPLAPPLGVRRSARGPVGARQRRKLGPLDVCNHAQYDVVVVRSESRDPRCESSPGRRRRPDETRPHAPCRIDAAHSRPPWRAPTPTLGIAALWSARPSAETARRAARRPCRGAPFFPAAPSAKCSRTSSRTSSSRRGSGPPCCRRARGEWPARRPSPCRAPPLRAGRRFRAPSRRPARAGWRALRLAARSTGRVAGTDDYIPRRGAPSKRPRDEKPPLGSRVPGPEDAPTEGWLHNLAAHARHVNESLRGEVVPAAPAWPSASAPAAPAWPSASAPAAPAWPAASPATPALARLSRARRGGRASRQGQGPHRADQPDQPGRRGGAAAAAAAAAKAMEPGRVSGALHGWRGADEPSATGCLSTQHGGSEGAGPAPGGSRGEDRCGHRGPRRRTREHPGRRDDAADRLDRRPQEGCF